MEDRDRYNQDFRKNLYNKYVSTFKIFIEDDNPASIKSVFEICRRRYLPLLSGLPDKDMRILELGCGSGYLLQFLRGEGYDNLFGIDISEQQIEKARTRGLKVENADTFEFFSANKTKYDVVFALDFIEHFYKDELLDLFTGINNTMEKNGILIIHTPNGQGLFPGRNIYGDLTHLTIFSPNSLTQILKITGFDDIKFFETGPVSKNFVGFIRLVLWKIVKLIVKLIRIIETGGKEDIISQDFVCSARKI